MTTMTQPRTTAPTNYSAQLQDAFLDALRKDKVAVSIFLVNGIKLQGQIERFDRYVVVLRSAGVQMVYKHAISTVVPSDAMRMGGPVTLTNNY